MNNNSNNTIEYGQTGYRPSSWHVCGVTACPCAHVHYTSMALHGDRDLGVRSSGQRANTCFVALLCKSGRG